MNGFLTNLIARSRAPVDVIRPRVPSLFEREGSSDLRELDLRNEADPVRPAPALAVDSAVRAAKRRDAEAPNVDAAVPTTRREVVERETGLIEKRVERTEHSIEPVSKLQPQVEVRHELVKSPPVPTQGPREVPLSVRQQVPNAASSEFEKKRELREVAVAPAESHAWGRVLAEGQPVQTPSRVGGPEARPALSLPVSRPRFEQATVKQTQPAVEPVVEVTIGCLEVRAVHEPTRSIKTRPQPSVMSLDEYLKTRTRGGSR